MYKVNTMVEESYTVKFNHLISEIQNLVDDFHPSKYKCVARVKTNEENDDVNNSYTFLNHFTNNSWYVAPVTLPELESNYEILQSRKCNGDNHYCFCGQRIRDLIYIQQIDNPTAPLLLVGNTCMEKFLHIDTKCKLCNKSIRITPRRNRSTFCKDCFLRMSREKNVYLRVPYKDKDEALELGCWWDQSKKLWYIPKNSRKWKYAKILQRFEEYNEQKDKILESVQSLQNSRCKVQLVETKN